LTGGRFVWQPLGARPRHAAGRQATICAQRAMAGKSSAEDTRQGAAASVRRRLHYADCCTTRLDETFCAESSVVVFLSLLCFRLVSFYCFVCYV